MLVSREEILSWKCPQGGSQKYGNKCGSCAQLSEDEYIEKLIEDYSPNIEADPYEEEDERGRYVGFGCGWDGDACVFLDKLIDAAAKYFPGVDIKELKITISQESTVVLRQREEEIKIK
jgi:hypothetical protein